MNIGLIYRQTMVECRDHRTGDTFRRYQAGLTPQRQYPSVMGPGLNVQRSCPHQKEQINSTHSFALHNSEMIEADRFNRVLVLQGEFSEQTLKANHLFRPRVDLLITPDRVLRSGIFEHYEQPAVSDAMSCDQNYRELFDCGIFSVSMPYIQTVLRYFLADIEQALRSDLPGDVPPNSVPPVTFGAASEPAEIIERVCSLIIKSGRLNLMDARYIFGEARLNTESISGLKKLVRQLALSVHPDRHPNDPQARYKFAVLTEAARLLLASWSGRD